MPEPLTIVAVAAAGAIGTAAVLREKRRQAEEALRRYGPTPAKTSTPSAAASRDARVVIYQQGVPETGTFAGQTATPLAARGYVRIGVNSRSALQRQLERFSSFRHLVLAGHGDPGYYFGGWGTGMSVRPEQLAVWLRGKIGATTQISLAGCRAGADPDTPPYSPIPGGAQSFAGRLRDLLVEGGAPSGGEIRTHTTIGHTTQNPYARLFRISATHRGRPGEDLLLEAGQPAADWMLGLAGFSQGLAGTGLGSVGAALALIVPVAVGIAVGAVLLEGWSKVPKSRETAW